MKIILSLLLVALCGCRTPQRDGLALALAQPDESFNYTLVESGTPGIVTGSHGFTYVASAEKPMFKMKDCLGNWVGRWTNDPVAHGYSVVVDPGTGENNCGMIFTK